MKRLFLLILLLFSTGLNAQFSPVWTIPSGYSQFEIKSFQMNDNGTGVLATVPYNGGPVSKMRFYTTPDFGLSWDSLYLEDVYAQSSNVWVTEGNVIYIHVARNVYPAAGMGYQVKQVLRSSDFGASWFTKSIDSVIGSNKEENLKFLNDSVGVFYYGNGMYVTMDYGTTWTNVLQKNLNNVSISEDGFVAYQNMEAFTFNPYTNQLDSMDYFPYSNGNVYNSAFKNGVAYRGIFSSHGTDFGSNYNYNFPSLHIDSLPLGDQTIVHFPQSYSIFGIDVTDACLHLVMDGWYVRSCDNAASFNFINGFNSDPNEYLVFLDFINDTVGFAVTINQVLQECKLWKTINGGGSNYLPVNSLHYDISLGILENTSAVSLAVFPNPTQGQFILRSETPLERFEIFNLLGEKIMSENVQQTEVNLDLSRYESGIYFVRAFSSKGLAEKRIVLAK